MQYVFAVLALLWTSSLWAGDPVVRIESDPISRETFIERGLSDLKVPAERDNLWNLQDPDPRYLTLWPIKDKPGHYLVMTYWQKDLLAWFDPLERARDRSTATHEAFGTQTIGYHFKGAEIVRHEERLWREGGENFPLLWQKILSPLYARHGDTFTLHITSWQTPILDREFQYEAVANARSSGRINVPKVPLHPSGLSFEEDRPYLVLAPSAVASGELLDRAQGEITGAIQAFLRAGAKFEPEAAIVYRQKELHNVYTLVAQQQATLNRFMSRAALWFEGSDKWPAGQLPPLDYDLLPISEALVKGHDIRGSALKTFCAAVRASGQMTDHERALIETVLDPLISAHGEDFVLLGISLQTASVTSWAVYWHELLHAQHFMDPVIDRMLWEFWATHPEAREAVVAGLKVLAYNTDNIPNNVTEMWAFTFDPGRRYFPPGVDVIFKTCAGPLLAAARAVGREPISLSVIPQ